MYPLAEAPDGMVLLKGNDIQLATGLRELQSNANSFQAMRENG